MLGLSAHWLKEHQLMYSLNNCSMNNYSIYKKIRDLHNVYTVISDDPQWKVYIRPLLFIIYINDFQCLVRGMGDIVLFADDTSLIFKVRRWAVDLGYVNMTLSQVLQQDCFTVSNLVLNSNKTKYLRFSLPDSKYLF